MPASVAALVRESLARVNGELQDLALGLTHDAGDLLGRATTVELGEGQPSGWSSPWGHSAPDVAGDVGAAAVPHGLSDEQLARAEAWSLDILDRVDASAGEDAEGASDLRREVGDGLSAGAGEPSALGEMSVTTEGAPDLSGPLWELDVLSGAGQGALAIAMSELSADPAGVGILGCIAVGGDFELALGDNGGDGG